jgi:hypothetical protein
LSYNWVMILALISSGVFQRLAITDFAACSRTYASPDISFPLALAFLAVWQALRGMTIIRFPQKKLPTVAQASCLQLKPTDFL